MAVCDEWLSRPLSTNRGNCVMKHFRGFQWLQAEWRRRHYSRQMVNLTAVALDKKSRRLIRFRSLIPNVVLIGSQKCGTTSLAQYLSSHPQIHVTCPMKEPGYFIFEDWAQDYWKSRGKSIRSPGQLLREHMLQGYNGQQWIMDASTYYTTAERVEQYGIPGRMRKNVSKIIYIVRNPYARMVSNYYHVRDRITCGFNELMDTDSSLLRTSCYWYQLAPFVNAFGRDNVKLLLFENFVRDPQATLDDVSHFLGVPRHSPPGGFPVCNQSANKESVRFQKKQFDRVHPEVLQQVAQIEDYLGRPAGWDLSEDHWCGPRA